MKIMLITVVLVSSSDLFQLVNFIVIILLGFILGISDHGSKARCRFTGTGRPRELLRRVFGGRGRSVQ